MPDLQAQALTQGITYDRIFVDGCRHQIHPRTITLHVMFITKERQIGSFKGAFITNGNQQVPSHFFGSMENVRPSVSRCLPDTTLQYLFVQPAQARPFLGLWSLYFLSRTTDVICYSSFASSTIIQDIKPICDAGQASMAYFYFDFRDINKQHWRGLVSSLLTQLSSHSDPRCDILSRLYTDHDNSAQQPSDSTLTRCLKEMLTLPDQPSTYLIMDALDECSNISGIPTPRKRVLQLVKELVDLHIPNLHICVTSRPEVDIRDVLEPLTSRRVCLHDQSGQMKDIEDYVRSVVTRIRNRLCGDGERRIRNWSLRRSPNELMECMYIDLRSCFLSELLDRFWWIFLVDFY